MKHCRQLDLCISPYKCALIRVSTGILELFKALFVPLRQMEFNTVRYSDLRPNYRCTGYSDAEQALCTQGGVCLKQRYVSMFFLSSVRQSDSFLQLHVCHTEIYIFGSMIFMFLIVNILNYGMPFKATIEYINMTLISKMFFRHTEDIRGDFNLI